VDYVAWGTSLCRYAGGLLAFLGDDASEEAHQWRAPTVIREGVSNVRGSQQYVKRLALLDDFFGDGRWYFFVLLEFHDEGALALGFVADVSGVAEHLRKGN